MKENFCTYEQALALKELGYNEPCFAKYTSNRLLLSINWSNIWCENINEFEIYAPLKSQVFKWFRDKHMIGHNIECPFVSYSGKNARLREDNRYMMFITDEDQLSLSDDEFYHNTYEEAESACIDKLIEIIKEKK